VSLLKVNVTKARAALAAEFKKPEGAFRKFGEAVIDQAEQMQKEAEALKTLPVPAAFTGKIPDTPEAQAAREQMAISKGKTTGSVYRPT